MDKKKHYEALEVEIVQLQMENGYAITGSGIPDTIPGGSAWD